jgi:hypothetical protein
MKSLQQKLNGYLLEEDCLTAHVCRASITVNSTKFGVLFTGA